MLIDLHTHIFPPEIIRERERYLERDAWFGQLYANPRAKMATAEELLASLDEAKIDLAVTFGFAWADPGLCQLANDYVLEALRRYPGRLVGLAVVNPLHGAKALREMERCLELGCLGVGELMPDGQGYALDDVKVMEPLLSALAERGLPALVHSNEPVGHIYRGKGKMTPEAIYRLAERFPQVTLICAHWGGGLFFYELMPEVRQALRNVYYDTAASLYLYDDAIFRVAAQIVPEKVLFATDYPLLSQRRFLRRVQGVGLAPETLEQVLGGNAQRLFLLPMQEPKPQTSQGE